MGEGWQGVQQEVTLTTEAGKNYFVRVAEHGASWYRRPRFSIEVVEEDEGRNLVLRSELAGKFRSLAGEQRSGR